MKLNFKALKPLVSLEEVFPAHSHRAERVGLFALLTIIASLLIVITYSILVPTPPPLSYPDLPLRIDGPTKVFYPQDIVPLTITRCNTNKHELIYTVTRTIKSIETKQTYIFPSTQVALEPGCSTGITRLHTIPEHIKPGLYQISGIGSTNGEDVHFYSEPFTILEKSKE